MGRALRLEWSRLQEPAIIAIGTSVLLLASLPPLASVLAQWLSAPASLSLLGRSEIWRVLAESLGLAVAISVLAVLLGVPLGLLFARAELPLRKILLAVHASALFLPPLLPALGWFKLFGREGWLGSAGSAEVLFGPVGLVLILTACFTPIVTVLTLLGVQGVDASLEEAARLSGPPWRVAWRVLVPCAMPAITLAGVVVFALSVSELAVPMFLRVRVYPAVVFSRLGGMDFAPSEALVMALPLIGITWAVVWLEKRLAGVRAIGLLASRSSRGTSLFPYRFAFVSIALLAAAISLMPSAALVAGAWGRVGLAELASWLGDSPWNGLRASFVAACAMTAIACSLGLRLAGPSAPVPWLDRLGMLTFILPAAILGIGTAQAWNTPRSSWIIGTFLIIVLGFVARYNVLALRTFGVAIRQIPRTLDEAAQIAGAHYFRRLRVTTLLAQRGVAATFAITLIFCLRDLETVALFYPPGGEPLTVRIFTLEANGPEAVVSGLAVVHVGITFVAVGVAALGLSRSRR